MKLVSSFHSDARLWVRPAPGFPCALRALEGLAHAKTRAIMAPRGRGIVPESGCGLPYQLRQRAQTSRTFLKMVAATQRSLRKGNMRGTFGLRRSAHLYAPLFCHTPA